MEQATGPKVLIEYTSRSAGKTFVVGYVTKEKYGLRKHGDTFEVYRADMAVRPDLFRPIAQEKPPPVVGMRGANAQERLATVARQEVAKAAPPPVKAAPPPPPAPEPIDPDYQEPQEPDYLGMRLSSLDWKGTKVNKNHLKILMSNGITSLGDLENTNEVELMKIKGIGDTVVGELYHKRDEYLS